MIGVLYGSNLLLIKASVATVAVVVVVVVTA